jgi:Domain of unknown function (DUF1905)/Bacteriocin-protection, YdeI or OmpD-Associated
MSRSVRNAGMGIAFSSKLIRPEGVGTWTFAKVPKAAATEAGFRARLRVKGTIDGVPFRSSLMPRGGGEVFVVVNQEIRERIHKRDGQSVRLELEIDSTPPLVTVPPVLLRALRADSKAKAIFDGFTASQRLAYVRWVSEAKQEPTRDRRVALTLEKLRRGEKLN